MLQKDHSLITHRRRMDSPGGGGGGEVERCEFRRTVSSSFSTT